MKAKVLALLKEGGDGYVSGQKLCERLGVSRTAVWKAITSLKEEGYKIEAVPSRGYHLVEAADVMTTAELATLLSTRWVGSRLVYFDETDSTNNQVRRLAEEGAPHGTLVVADAQTLGKGRRGRSWASPHGTAIAMSLLVRPQFAPQKASMLTLVAGMAVAEGVRRVTGLSPLIKWPNDVVVRGRKICGILTEMSTEEEQIRYVVVGIGINVNITEFPEELSQTATSLRLELGRDVRRAPLIAAVALAFEEYFDTFARHGNLEGLREQYDSILANRGRQVRVLDPAGEYSGVALGVCADGSLLVEKEDASLVHVISGEVSVRGIYGYV